MSHRRLRTFTLLLAGLVLLQAAWLVGAPVWAASQTADGLTYYLPLDTQPVCVGQKVVIRGGYILNPLAPVVPDAPDPLAPLVIDQDDALAPLVPDAPDPLAPLVKMEIHNQASRGSVSQPRIQALQDSGLFSFTFTATQAGNATIRSEIPGYTQPAILTLKVTDRCQYIYGLRIDFTINVQSQGTVRGDYFMWAGGYLKADPKDPSRLSNDSADSIALGGQLSNFDVGKCKQSNMPLGPKTASLKAKAHTGEDDPLVHIDFEKGLFRASGTWVIFCDGKAIDTRGDPFAGSMIMMDGVLGRNDAWATAHCPAAGGSCSITIPSLSLMRTVWEMGSGGTAQMPFTVDLMLEKVK
jgi:hypothetical protein